MNHLEKTVFQAVVAALPEEIGPVSPEDSLESLGVSSLELLNTLFQLESEFGVNILAQDATAADFHTVGDTTRRVVELLSAPTTDGGPR